MLSAPSYGWQCREVSKGLAARALFRASQEAGDDAWQDLLACHRLGRLVGRGGTLVEGLNGYVIDNMACWADLTFLERAKPSAKRIENCLRDLQELTPLPVAAEKLDWGERFLFLNTLMMIDRHGLDYLEALSAQGPKPAGPLDELAARWRAEIVEGIDWNPALQNANRWYDRLAAATREKDRGSREKKLNQLEAELRALKAQLVEKGGVAGLLLGDDSAKGEIIGDILTCLLVPAVRKFASGPDRAMQIQDNVILAFALAWYERDHGRYPKNLNALAPKYLAQIPQDIFSGKALVYRLHENGYLLYSVGVNGKDDAGRGYDDKPPGDDLSVRMPLPELRRK